MQDLKIALVQMNPAWESIEANLEAAGRHIDSIGHAVDLVVLPEMFTTGFTMNARGCSQTMDGSAARWLRETARRIDADIAGSVIIAEEGRFYNRLLWAKPEGSVLHYDKRHLFRMAGEHETYAAGTANITVELKGWRLRPFICYDLRFPAWTRNKNNEYDAAIYVASWPAPRASHWTALLKARAIENLCYVIGVNRTGTDGNGVSYSGGSAVFDFAGTALVDAGASECVSIVKLHRDQLLSYREKFPAWMDGDEFTVKM